MNRILKLLLLLIVPVWMSAQQAIWINELDSDTPGLDTEEFIEIKSAQPNFPLDGYVVVFFNGSSNANNSSYWAIDLDGYVTDINGLFLIGNEAVVPFPQHIIPDNTIQNGADGVAIYRGNDVDFPIGTTAFVDETLVDVIVYGTNDADAETMLEIFRAFNPAIYQINEGKSNNTNSIQRDNNGNYYTATPTPRKNNDGSGADLIGVRTIFPKTVFTEGDVFELTFQSERPVDHDLIIKYSLDNGAFNGADYAATTLLTLQKGKTSESTTIQIIDDNLDEGDEDMIFRMEPLPTGYLVLNNNIRIRVEDNDFKVANYGTPINPTYGKVIGTIEQGYYDTINGKFGADLKNALQSIIASPDIVRCQSYNDVVDILTESDVNPENSNQVWLVYLEQGRSKLDVQLNSDNAGKWNREHVWPRSRGGFFSIAGDEVFDGIDFYTITNADSVRHGNSDAHHIRTVDGPENTRRGNKFYGQYTGPDNTLGGFRGDVARSIFYMAIRYNGLELVNGYPEGEVGKFGDLATLLEWHRNDPPDDFEMHRNNVVQKWQFNRNPFIDMPDLVEYIWGDKTGSVWNNPTATDDALLEGVRVFPNPASDFIRIESDTQHLKADLFDNQGRWILSSDCNQNCNIGIEHLTPNVYLLRLSDGNGHKRMHKIAIQ